MKADKENAMADENEIKTVHNPERYERMSEPYADKADASAALLRFYERLDALREECRIPELILSAAVYWHDESGERLGLVSETAFGASHTWPTLAARLFARHAQPEIERCEKLKALATGEKP